MVKIKVGNTHMDNNEAWIGLQKVFSGLAEKFRKLKILKRV